MSADALAVRGEQGIGVRVERAGRGEDLKILL
jgi:hypothetical protein